MTIVRRRLLTNWLIIMAFVLLVFVALPELRDRIDYLSRFYSVVVSIASAGLLVWTTLFVWRTSKLVKEATRKDGLLCKYCGYDLRATTNLRAEHRCAECGREFDPDALRRYWSRYSRAFRVK